MTAWTRLVLPPLLVATVAGVVAQSANGANSTIGCKITVDDAVIVQNSSQGQYAVVTCSGNA